VSTKSQPSAVRAFAAGPEALSHLLAKEWFYTRVLAVKKPRDAGAIVEWTIALVSIGLLVVGLVLS
jgi:hypothetical protein